MPSPGPGGSQSSLAGMVVSWLTSQFRTGPKQQPKKGAPIASYTMGTDPTALGGNARGDVTQFRDTFQPTTSMFQPNYGAAIGREFSYELIQPAAQRTVRDLEIALDA